MNLRRLMIIESSERREKAFCKPLDCDTFQDTGSLGSVSIEAGDFKGNGLTGIDSQAKTYLEMVRSCSRSRIRFLRKVVPTESSVPYVAHKHETSIWSNLQVQRVNCSSITDL